METNNLFCLYITAEMAYISLALLNYTVIQMVLRMCFRTVWYITDIQMFLLCSLNITVILRLKTPKYIKEYFK